MKKAQLKTMLLLFLISMVIIISTYALTVTLNEPSSNWETDSDVTMNFTPSGELSSYSWCAIFTNKTGSFVKTANYTDVINGSNYARGISFVDSTSITSYVWNAYCYNGSDVIGDSSNNTFGVDSTPPTIVLNFPDDSAYLDTDNFNLSYTPTDSSNLATCKLYNNMSGTWNLNSTNSSPVSGQIARTNYSSIPDGDFIWNILCNDSVNNVWAEDANRSFTVDTTLPADIKITEPINNTISTDRTPQVTWNKTNETNFRRYIVSLSDTVGMTNVIQTKEITTITELSVNLSTIETESTYYLNVTAEDYAGHTTGSEVFVYTLDRTNPSITLNNPSGNNTYTNDNTFDFNVTVLDANPDCCSLYLSNLSGYSMTKGNASCGVVNNTQLNLTPTTMLEGVYQFNVECNDSAGNIANATSDAYYQITVDTISPGQPNLTITWGGTNNTDLTPTLSWLTITELNFDRYIARALYVGNDTVAFESNVTTRTVNYTSMSLKARHTYNFTVTALDLASNSAVSINTTQNRVRYYVDSICGTLPAGWNMCGATWVTSKNLSVIGGEVNAPLVSIWNVTGHVWSTCNYAVSPGGANCNFNTGINNDDSHAVMVYVNASTNWRNRTWSANKGSSNITLTNVSNGWNTEGSFFRGGRVLGDMGRNFGQDNVTMFSIPYTNGTTVPFVNIGTLFSTLNNLTDWSYGLGMWVYYNGTGTNALGRVNSSIIYNVGSW